MNKKYWIAAISKEHTLKGVTGGFTQVCHGKQGPLKRMAKGDYLIIYSSKISMEGKEKCQSFTAIGEVNSEEIYQYQMSEDFIPFRRNIDYLPCVETSILPLINDLEFIQNKKYWGYPFRVGFFEISQHDFELISSFMIPDEHTEKLQ